MLENKLEEIVSNSEFLIGYAKKEQFLIKNTTEQICAFIMKYRYADVIITDVLDGLEIKTAFGFIDYCRNQDFLRKELIPMLAPMQMGNKEIPEFIPYEKENEEEE